MKRFRCLMCIMAAVFMLAGCGAAKNNVAYDSDYGNYANSDMAVSKPSSSVSGGWASESMDAVFKESASMDSSLDFTETTTNSQTDTAGLTERKYIRSFRITAETLEFDAFVAAIENEVKSLGGYIQNSSVNGTGINSKHSSRQASVTIRIPNEVLDEFVNKIGTNANITYKFENTEDVTLSYIDMESRVKTLEIQHERLLALLEKADSVDSIVSLESRLSDVLYEIEYYKSQLRNYDSLIAYSTVNLTINEVVRMTVVEEESFGERISNGLSETFYEMGEDIKDFIVDFITNLPYIIIWGVILGLIVGISVRIIKKHLPKRAKKPEQVEEKAE